MVARFGRQKRFAENVTTTLVYTYSADGLRVAQAIDGDETSYAWDWASGLPELLSDGASLYLVGHDTLGRFAEGASWEGGVTIYTYKLSGRLTLTPRNEDKSLVARPVLIYWRARSAVVVDEDLSISPRLILVGDDIVL